MNGYPSSSCTLQFHAISLLTIKNAQAFLYIPVKEIHVQDEIQFKSQYSGIVGEKI